MKWLKHLSISRNDPKIRKLIRTHGAKGFGIYWMINELIAENLEHDFKCILEHSLDDLSEIINEPKQDIETVLEFCASKDIRLMTKQGSQYQNLKVLEYADEYIQRTLKKWHNQPKTPDSVPIVSRYTPESVGKEEKRLEEIREEEKRKDKKVFTSNSIVFDSRSKEAKQKQLDELKEHIKRPLNKTHLTELTKQIEIITNELKTMNEEQPFEINF